MKTKNSNKTSASVLMFLTLMLFGATGTLAQTPTLRTNGKIAFTSDRDGNREIYVMNNDGTGQVRLTTNPARDDYPMWSPDGGRIAFLSGNALKLMNADGTNQTQLTTVAVAPNCANDFGLSCGLSWSPDGTKIAFTDAAGILTIKVDGSNRINLTNSPTDTHPSWSPDGSRIVFARNTGSPSVTFLIYTINADGTNLTLWNGSGSSGNLGDLDPAWSPDGTRIAAILNRFPIDSSDLCIMNADGTRYTIDFAERDHASPAWSPDGAKIAFGGGVDPYVQYTNSEIFVINADGSGITQLTTTPSYEGHPAWQPLASASCPNPIDCAEVFVRQHYLDFLNREPDAGGLAYWTNQITQCGTDVGCLHQRRIGVSAAFFIELEYQQTAAYVYRLYRAAYGNHQPFPNPNPDPDGGFLHPILRRHLVDYNTFSADRAQVIGRPDLPQALLALANDFVQRPAFLEKYPANLTGAQFVDAVLTTLRTDTDASVDLSAQRDALIAEFNAGGRGRVLYRLADDNVQNPINNRAFIDAEYNRAFVLTQYFGYLRRDPDLNGINFWFDVLNRQPNNYRGMVCAFLTSAEYQHRFGSIVTRNDNDCAP